MSGIDELIKKMSEGRSLFIITPNKDLNPLYIESCKWGQAYDQIAKKYAGKWEYINYEKGIYRPAKRNYYTFLAQSLEALEKVLNRYKDPNSNIQVYISLDDFGSWGTNLRIPIRRESIDQVIRILKTIFYKIFIYKGVPEGQMEILENFPFFTPTTVSWMLLFSVAAGWAGFDKD